MLRQECNNKMECEMSLLHDSLVVGTHIDKINCDGEKILSMKYRFNLL